MITPLSSLIPPDLSAIEATKLAGQGGSALKFGPSKWALTVDGKEVPGAVHLNNDGNSGNAARGYRFAAPYTDNVIFTVPMSKVPVTSGSHAPVIYLTNATGTVLASQVCSLEAAGRYFSVTAPVVGGQEYQARITVYDGALGAIQNSQAIIGPAHVRMANRAASGLFSRNFLRIDAVANDTVHYTVYNTLRDGWTEFSSLAEIELETDAESLVVQYRSTTDDQEFCSAAVLIGNPGTRARTRVAQIKPLVMGRLAYSPEIALPAGRKRLVVRQGPWTGGLAMFITAVLVPTGTNTVVVPQQPGRTLLVLSDSIGSGSMSTTVQPSAGSWSAALGFPAVMRDKFRGNVVLDTYGGRSLGSDGYVATGGVLSAAAGHVAQREALMWRVGQCQPTDMLILLGCNDWWNSGNGVSAANLQVAYEALLTDLHVRFPYMRIFAMTPVYRASLYAETSANAGGATMPQLRTAISNAVAAVIAARSVSAVPPKIKVVDGLSAAGASRIGVDGLHLAGGPNYWASEDVALYVLGQMEA